MTNQVDLESWGDGWTKITKEDINQDVFTDPTCYQRKLKKVYLIYNPVGGVKKRNSKTRELFLSTFAEAGIEVDERPTEYANHAFELASKLLDFTDYDGIFTIGGDGTVHEICNGLLSREDGQKIAYGVVPGGSGNSLARDLGPLDVSKLIPQFTKGITHYVDAASIMYGTGFTQGPIYSVNIVGTGLINDVNVSAEKKRWIGTSRYTLFTITNALTHKRRKGSLEIDGELIEKDVDWTFVTGLVGKYTGKGNRLAPHAKLDDGLSDMVYVKGDAWRYQVLTLFPKVFNGTHLSSNVVHYKQAKEWKWIPTISTKSETTSWVDKESLCIDGEVKGGLPVHYKTLPSSLRIFI